MQRKDMALFHVIVAMMFLYIILKLKKKAQIKIYMKVKMYLLI